MGRPQKKGLDHFCLPVDFFSQDIISALRSEFGLKGEISLIKILCNVFRYGYYLKWNPSMRLRILGELPGVNAELLGQIVQRLVKWGFFDAELYRKHRVLTSAQIQQEYFSLTRRRRQSERLPYLLIIADINGVSADNNGVYVCNNSVNVDNNPVIEDINGILQNNSPDNIGVFAGNNEIIEDINGVSADNNGVYVCNNSVNVDNNPKTENFFPFPPITPLSYKEKKITPIGVIKKKKGKKELCGNEGGRRKEKSCAKKEKTVQNPPTLEQVEEYCRQINSSVDAKKFLSNYSAVGWVTGNGIPITDWRAKLDEWTINEKTKCNDNGKKNSGAGNAIASGDPQLPHKKGDTVWSGSDI